MWSPFDLIGAAAALTPPSFAAWLIEAIRGETLAHLQPPRRASMPGERSGGKQCLPEDAASLPLSRPAVEGRTRR